MNLPEPTSSPPGRVVVFTGHLIDSPARKEQGLPPRFPPDPDLERRVKEAIRAELDALDAGVGYSSAACGGDLLFAEAMRERNAELHLVLPFDREDFLRTSVDYGLAGMAGWRERFDRAMAGAASVRYSHAGGYGGNDGLFERANDLLFELAVSHASALGTEPAMLAVLDPASDGAAGGSAHFLDRWVRSGYPARVIDLAELRARAFGGTPGGVREATGPPGEAS